MDGIHEDWGGDPSGTGSVGRGPARFRRGGQVFLGLLAASLAACAPMSDTRLSNDGGGSGDGPPLAVTGNWIFGIETASDDCGEVGPFQYLLVYMLQDGGDVAIHLDLDGNQAFTEGATVHADVSGQKLLIAGNYPLAGGDTTVHWVGEIESPVWGHLSGTVVETVVDETTGESCERELWIATVRTANPPGFDLTGAWDMTTTVEWGSGGLAGSVGATETHAWDIVQSMEGIDRGALRILENAGTEGGGSSFLGMVNSGQMTLARHSNLLGAEVTYLYTTLNFTEGWEAGDRLDGQLIAEVRTLAGDVDTIGWAVSGLKSVPEGLSGPGGALTLALPAIPLCTPVFLGRPR